MYGEAVGEEYWVLVVELCVAVSRCRGLVQLCGMACVNVSCKR